MRYRPILRLFLFLCEVGSYSTDVVEHVCREQQGVVQGHAKFLCSLGGRHCGVVNCDGEVFERAGLPPEEEQFRLVEVEVVGQDPS